MGTAPDPYAEPFAVVWLGNRHAVEVVDDPDDVALAAEEARAPKRVRRAAPAGKRCMYMVIPAESGGTAMTLLQAAYDVTHPTGGVWQAHSDGPPAWVASTHPQLAQLLAAHFGCEVREPDPDHLSSEPAPDAATGA